MTISELRGWLAALPIEFDDMSLVFRKYDTVANKDIPADQKEIDDDESDYYYALDTPISSGLIDVDSRECCLLDKESRTFIVKMNEKLEKKE